MRVVHPNVYLKQQQRGRRVRRIRTFIMVMLVLLATGYGFMAMSVKATFQPVPFDISIGAQRQQMEWPSTGSVALTYQGADVLPLNNNGSVSVPSASTIKILTALIVLQKKPLELGESGETITFIDEDVQNLQVISARGGAVYPITAGETMTYNDALQIMLMVSANNIADKLAVWAYGSSEAYLEAATVYASDNKLSSTKVSDASGLSSASLTSPNDLVRIASSFLGNPLLKSIVSQKTASLSNGKIIENTNMILGIDGITGVKTGFTDEAGACLVVSKDITVVNTKFTLISAVMGQPDRPTAYSETQRLLDKFKEQFSEVSLLTKDQKVAKFVAPWGAEADVVNRDDINLVRYVGESFNASFNIDPISYGKKHDQVGILNANTKNGSKRVELELTEDLPAPPLSWRLKHAIDYFDQI